MVSKIQELREALDSFYASEYAEKTVKELLTSTSNIALPTLVQARAVLELKNWVDLRPYTHRVRVPKGAGKTVEIQRLTQPEYSTWTEGSSLSAADPTVAKASATIEQIGKNTKVSDLLANTSAINFVEEIGRIHGGCVAQGIFDKIVDAIAGLSGVNTVSVGTKGDGTEADFTLSNVADAISEILEDGYRPDHIVTSPTKLWTAFTTDYDVKQFYGALSDLMISGSIPKVLGLEWLMDPYFEKAITGGSWDGSDGEKYALLCSRGFSAAWAEMMAEPITEIYRLPPELSVYVITHLDGGAAGLAPGSVCVIQHAA